MAEFITNDQKTPEYELNPDFDFDLGTVEFYFLYTDSSHWIRGSQIISLKNELIDHTALNVEMNHPRKLSINFHSTYYSNKCDGAAIGEWHKVILKWKRLGTEVNLYLKIDDNQAVEEQFEVMEEFMAHLDSMVETQIFIGNDTYRKAQFNIDDFTFWRKWKE